MVASCRSHSKKGQPVVRRAMRRPVRAPVSRTRSPLLVITTATKTRWLLLPLAMCRCERRRNGRSRRSFPRLVGPAARGRRASRMGAAGCPNRACGGHSGGLGPRSSQKPRTGGSGPGRLVGRRPLARRLVYGTDRSAARDVASDGAAPTCLVTAPFRRDIERRAGRCARSAVQRRHDACRGATPCRRTRALRRRIQRPIHTGHGPN